jgi:UDP-N-acetylglucosamine 2-epimerase
MPARKSKTFVAEVVITDSGGIQEETTYLGIPA